VLNQVLQGDCLELMRSLEDNSIDAIVTDPPAGISFMGKDWDGDKGGRKQWCAYMEERFAEALRVCKPGAHALVWALPRTSHWTATALEDAGWEIRDIVTHLFGAGFPKSLDIGKKIDEMAGVEREIIGERIYGEGQHRRGKTATIFGVENVPIGTETEPSTSEAKQWDGWGSSLKPASEHWILCRKPVEGTIVANVLTHGVGGINVDACRIEYASNYDKQHQEDIARGQENATNGRMFGSTVIESKPSSLVMKGRWPANLVLSHSVDCRESECADGCAIAVLNEQAGIRTSGVKLPHHKCLSTKTKNSFGERERLPESFPGSSVSASRFFPNFHYYPKASQRDRTCNKTVENNHPTVKNRDLMRWLVKLITPPEGIVLDMFGGSGSTAIACIEEGFNYLLLEQETEFVAIAQARIEAVMDEKHPSLEQRVAWLETQVRSQSTRLKKVETGQLSLFEQLEVV
jgi:DNA modification methylase